ncbi:MAG: DUF3494 domain-containing protein [Bryobacteraceae bacterium]|nr:DUF3494 domain-containing protein [Bryobacteraceae bacterium]
MTLLQKHSRTGAAPRSWSGSIRWVSLALCVALSGATSEAAEILIPPVPLGTAANFAILSKAGISTTGDTAILGNIGVSPIASTAITGFGLTLQSSLRFSLSSQVLGRVFAASYAAPTPANLTEAVGFMQAAYTRAAGRGNPNFLNFGGGNIGGRVLAPGLYKWGSGVIIPTNVTLHGSKNAVWIFQVAGTLNIASGKRMILSGGALPDRIFWQVAGAVTLGTTSQMSGNILGKTSIAMQTGARLNGRLLAQTAVTLDANAITRPPL